MPTTYFPSGIQVGPRMGEGAKGGTPVARILAGGGAVASGATSASVALPGSLVGDRVFAQARSTPANASAIAKAVVTAAGVVTVTVTADPGAGGLEFDLLAIGTE